MAVRLQSQDSMQSLWRELRQNALHPSLKAAAEDTVVLGFIPMVLKGRSVDHQRQHRQALVRNADLETEPLRGRLRILHFYQLS